MEQDNGPEGKHKPLPPLAKNFLVLKCLKKLTSQVLFFTSTCEAAFEDYAYCESSFLEFLEGLDDLYEVMRGLGLASLEELPPLLLPHRQARQKEMLTPQALKLAEAAQASYLTLPGEAYFLARFKEASELFEKTFRDLLWQNIVEEESAQEEFTQKLRAGTPETPEEAGEEAYRALVLLRRPSYLKRVKATCEELFSTLQSVQEEVEATWEVFLSTEEGSIWRGQEEVFRLLVEKATGLSTSAFAQEASTIILKETLPGLIIACKEVPLKRGPLQEAFFEHLSYMEFFLKNYFPSKTSGISLDYLYAYADEDNRGTRPESSVFLLDFLRMLGQVQDLGLRLAALDFIATEEAFRTLAARLHAPATYSSYGYFHG